MIIRLNSNKQVLNDRKTVVAITEQVQLPIQNVDPEKQNKMENLNDIITSNWMFEICKITREVLKMRSFPFNRYKWKLCYIASYLSFTKDFVTDDLLKNIHDIRIKENSRAPEDDGTLINYRFDDTRFPLYIWKFKDFKNEITKFAKRRRSNFKCKHFIGCKRCKKLQCDKVYENFDSISCSGRNQTIGIVRCFHWL